MKKIILFFPISFLILSINLAKAVEPSSEIIFQAMHEEMDRSLSQLKLDVFGPPYFVNYQIRHHDHVEVLASYGSLVKSKTDQNRILFVDVRVGDSQFDSSMLGSHTHRIDHFLPLDDDLEGIKRALWYETDLRYKQAIMNFLKKKGQLISGSDPHPLADFSIGSKRIHEIKPIPEFIVDIENWEEIARKISKLFKSAPEIERTQVKINADRIVRYYYDSENNKIRDSVLQYRVTLEAWTKADSGGPLHDIETLIFSDPTKLPSEAELTRLAKKMIAGINRLQKAPLAEPYVGPAVFSPDANSGSVSRSPGSPIGRRPASYKG